MSMPGPALPIGIDALIPGIWAMPCEPVDIPVDIAEDMAMDIGADPAGACAASAGSSPTDRSSASTLIPGGSEAPCCPGTHNSAAAQRAAAPVAAGAAWTVPWAAAKKKCSASSLARTAPAMPGKEHSLPVTPMATENTPTKATSSAQAGIPPPDIITCPTADSTRHTAAKATARSRRRSDPSGTAHHAPIHPATCVTRGWI